MLIIQIPRFETFSFKESTAGDTLLWEKNIKLDKVLAEIDKNINVDAHLDVIKSNVYTVEDLRKTFKVDNN